MNDEIKAKVTKYADRRYWVMYYLDPVTGKTVTRSTKQTTKREAERTAAKWEAELHAGRYVRRERITWSDFRERYDREKLSSLSPPTAEATDTAFNHVEAIVNPKHLANLTPAVLSHFQSELRRKGLRETSIATHLRHLAAALSWAVKVGLLAKAPSIERPQRVKGQPFMRGRPVTGEEFDRMIVAVDKVRPDDADDWKRYLRSLYLSGLRLEESTVLSWDDSAGIAVDLSGRHPRLRIYAEHEKGNTDRLLPMTPDFAEFLAATPEAQRSGPVFRVIARTTGQPMSLKRICRVIFGYRQESRREGRRDNQDGRQRQGREGDEVRHGPRTAPFVRHPLGREGQAGHAATTDASPLDRNSAAVLRGAGRRRRGGRIVGHAWKYQHFYQQSPRTNRGRRPRRSSGIDRSSIFSRGSVAEGMGFEPTTLCGAPDFESCRIVRPPSGYPSNTGKIRLGRSAIESAITRAGSKTLAFSLASAA